MDCYSVLHQTSAMASSNRQPTVSSNGSSSQNSYPFSNILEPSVANQERDQSMLAGSSGYTIDSTLYGKPSSESLGSSSIPSTQSTSAGHNQSTHQQPPPPQSAPSPGSNILSQSLRNLLDLSSLLSIPSGPSTSSEMPHDSDTSGAAANSTATEGAFADLSDSNGRTKSRRRRKPINCSFCRRRKLKCDRKQPCSSCIRRNMQSSCTYAADFSNSSDPYGDSPLNFYENTPNDKLLDRATPYSQTGSGYGDYMSTGDFAMSQARSASMGEGGSSSISSNSLSSGTPAPSMSQPTSSSLDGTTVGVRMLLNQILAPPTPAKPPTSMPAPNPPNHTTNSATRHTTNNLPPSLAPFQNIQMNTRDSPISHASVASTTSISLSNPPTGTPASGPTPAAGIPTSSGMGSTPNSLSDDHVGGYHSSYGGSSSSSGSGNGPRDFVRSTSFNHGNSPYLVPSSGNRSAHMRNGAKVSGSQISIGSLAPLLGGASRYGTQQSQGYKPLQTPSPLSSTPSSAASSASADELQSRLETMERLLMTLVKQQSSSTTSGGEARRSPSSNSPTSPSVNSSHHRNSIGSTNSGLSGRNSGKSDSNSAANPANSPCNDDTMSSLRESLGMLKLDTTGKSVYHGDTHWGSLITEIDEVTEILGKLKAEALRESNKDDLVRLTPNSGVSPQGSQSDQERQPVGSSQNPADQETTGGCFSNNSYFATLQSNENYMKVLDTLPPREQCDILIERYFGSFNAIYPIINKTTFIVEYYAFWQDPSITEMSWMAMLLGVLCLALQSYATDTINFTLDPNDNCLSPEKISEAFPSYFQKNPEHYWGLWLEGAEYCANSWKLNFKPSIANIRAMLIITMCQHPASLDFDWMDQNWIDIANIVRIAQTMGMHRDPQWFALDPYEREERRRLWYLMQSLDMYQTLLQGLPSLIRTGTCDVQFPTHVNLSQVAKHWKYFENTGDSPDSVHSVMPIASEPLGPRTEMSFFLARAGISMLSTQIYNITTSLENPNVPYEQVLTLDSKIRLMFNRANSYLMQSVIDNNSASGVDDESGSEPNSPDSIRNIDSPIAMLERFLYEIDYLKALMVLHRKYSSKGVENLKYRRSREESIYCAERMLMLQEWFYRSEMAVPLREKYSYIVTKIVFPQFTHAIIMLALYFIGSHFDSYPLHTARTHLRRIEVSFNIAFEVGRKTSDLHIVRHMHLHVILLREAKAVFNMTPAEREQLKEQRQQRKQRHSNKQFTASSSKIVDKLFSCSPSGPSKEEVEQYSSGYNTFFYASWEFDTLKRQAAVFSQNPDQFYNEWKLEHFMDVDDDLNSALGAGQSGSGPRYASSLPSGSSDH